MQHCASACHTADVVAGHTGSREDRELTLQEMIALGAWLPDAEREAVLAYLTAQFPVRVNINALGADALRARLGLSAELATAIVAYREANGAIRSLEALTEVEGITTDQLAARERRLWFDVP
jgi:competence ComEA-like helix-hairpin-helix protein